jgi:3-phenylpropionate/cinnamic acid dioxygenase small subunit
MTDVSPTVTGVVGAVAPDIIAFILLEARLADEARYSEWEALWDDDACYWVPRHERADPDTEVSYIFDNRQRIASRIRQLNTGVRHSQTPPSKMRRLVTNFELLDEDENTVTVGTNFALYEYRYSLVTWVGRYLYKLHRTDGGWRLMEKTVHLINSETAVSTMSFLI